MILHLATLMLVALKLMHHIDWSWWLVFAPSIFYLVVFCLFPLVLCGVGLMRLRG